MFNDTTEILFEDPAAMGFDLSEPDDDEDDIIGVLDGITALLDDAEGLTPLQRVRLLGELAKLRKVLADNPTGMVKLKSAQRLAAIRRDLGAAMVKPPAPAPVPAPEETDPDKIAFGLAASGIKTRERINSQVRGLIERMRGEGMTAKDLTAEERALLVQYSGKGGLTENSQSEYYTPTPVAEGTWDMLKANGFENGNVLEPSTGAGVFSATKPKGVIISGAEIDGTSSAVAQLLHPEDRITNTSFEKMALATADDTFDAVTGNVPFGVRGKESKHDPDYKNERRMERYFVRRVLDKVRPGGLVTLIVPPAVVGKKDKTWERWRADLSMHAEFLGAHKLPSKTFGKQGTDVVTDIIVLRKHPRELLDKIQNLPVATLKAANVIWPEFIEGKWFQGEGLPFIHGQFVPADPTAARSEDKVIALPDMTDESLKRRLAARFDSRIDWAMLDAAQVVPRAYAEGDRKVINGQQMEMRGGQWVPFVPTEAADTVLDPAVYGVDSLAGLEALLRTSDGMLSLTAEQAFKAWKRFPHLFNGVQSQAVEFAMSQPADKFRDVAYRGSLLGAMVTKYAIGDDATDRERVIALLQAEMAKFGHPSTIAGMVLDGAKAQAFGAYLGAIDSKGKVSAAVRGEVERAKGFESDNILSIVAYLIRQSGDAVDVPMIAKLYNGPRTLAGLGDIADVTGVAITANGDITTTATYCSGDIYTKVQDIQNAQDGATDERVKAHWTRLIELLLSKVKRTDVSAIGFGLRDNWIEPKYKLEFLRLNGYEVGFVNNRGESIAENDGEQAEARTGGVWQYRGKDEFRKQLCHYLAGNSIGHNLRDRSDATAVERKTEYQEKVQGLEEQFKFFMQSHQDGSDLASTYDMTFNRHVTPDYDTEPLGLKGVSANVKTHPYQNAGVRRLSEEGSGILGYDVGLGKTFTSLAFSVYDRQMGRSKKHCTVVPKSVLANWYMESKKMLGTHQGVLFVGFEPKRDKKGNIVTEPVLDENNQPKRNQHTGEIEFQDVLVEDSPAEVFAKMHSIPAMAGGLVIMTQEKFKTIPLKPETVAAYGDKWVERSMTSAANAERLAGKDVKDKSYAKEKQKAGLENQFYEEGTKKKEELPFFEDMGFDRVIVDEAHHYKASFQVKEGMDKLAYLPNPAESQRAQDMALKLSHVRDTNGGKGSILLTATPVANSPIEIYNMLLHVVPPEEMDKLGIYTPADFVRFFGRIESVQKLTVAGVVEPRDGLKGFRNLNILRGLFNRYSNMLTATDVDPDGSVLKLPDAQEVKSQCDMTDEQQAAYVALRIEANDAGNPRKVAAGEARPMFAVLRDMDRVTTDVDLYTKTMTFLFKAAEQEKVKAMIADLPATAKRKEVDEDTGEKVEVDVPKQTGFTISGETLTYVAPDAFEFAIATRLKKFGIGYASHPLTPKYAELVKNLKAELAVQGKQLIFTEEKSQHGKLERLLVENLPEDEARIGIINADTASGEKLQEIVDAYTRGDFTIVICNRKAEVGVNLQRGTTAVHHMTLPWNPASIQQRNGRAVRQGNKVASVRIYYYQAKGSFDEYRLDLLSKKASWIGALLSKDNTDDEHDNENAASDIEQAALLSDNREQFLAQLAADQAKKEAAAKERRDSAAKVGLGQIAAAREFVRTFESRKAKALAEIQGDLDKAVQALARSEAVPDADPEKQARTIERRKTTINYLQRKLAAEGPRMDAKRSDAEARTRQLSSTLKAQASRGELPFDVRLVDAPEESLLTNSKQVVTKGGIYEVDGPDGKDVFRVVGLSRETREVEVEYIVKAITGYRGPSDGTYDAEKLLGAYGREVHYNDAEIQVLKLVSMPIVYAQIGDRVSKDVFLANRDRITTTAWCLRRSPAGELLVKHSTDKEGGRLVYPDRADKALAKEVAALWSAVVAGTGGYELSRARGDVMGAIFGDDWQNAVAEYVKTATPEQMRGQAAELLRKFTPDLQTTAAAADEAWKRLGAIGDYYEGKNTPEAVAMRAWAMGEGYVNTAACVDALKSAASNMRVSLQIRIGDLKREEAAKADRERQAASASDPRFKDLTDSQRERFRALSITAQFNNGEAAGKFQPFTILAMKDNRGFSGILRRVKDMMKPRFGASWLGANTGGKYAETWTVPASTDVDALLSFLED